MMNERTEWIQYSLLLALVLVVFGCGEDGDAPVVINDRNQEAGGDNDPVGGDGQELGFGLTEFIYQSGDRELSSVEIIDIDAEPAEVSRSVFYEHPHDIHSFAMVRDRSGVVFTAERPDIDTYFTQPAYFIDADGQEPTLLVDPIEVTTQVSTLRVESSVGRLTDRIWFTIFESQTDPSGNLVTTNTPTSLDDGQYLDVHTPACNSFSHLSPEPNGQRLAVVEQFCENHHENAYVTVYEGGDFSGRKVVASQGDGGLDLRMPGSMDWFTHRYLIVGLMNRDLVLLDTEGEEPPSVIGEDVFSDFALSPDRSLFVGVNGSELLVTTMPDFDVWWNVADDSVGSAPSW